MSEKDETSEIQSRFSYQSFEPQHGHAQQFLPLDESISPMRSQEVVPAPRRKRHGDILTTEWSLFFDVLNEDRGVAIRFLCMNMARLLMQMVRHTRTFKMYSIEMRTFKDVTLERELTRSRKYDRRAISLWPSPECPSCWCSGWLVSFIWLRLYELSTQWPPMAGLVFTICPVILGWRGNFSNQYMDFSWEIAIAGYLRQSWKIMLLCGWTTNDRYVVGMSTFVTCQSYWWSIR